VVARGTFQAPLTPHPLLDLSDFGRNAFAQDPVQGRGHLHAAAGGVNAQREAKLVIDVQTEAVLARRVRGWLVVVVVLAHQHGHRRTQFG
jgi:hypothetical protein